jgi:hypothetical protein
LIALTYCFKTTPNGQNIFKDNGDFANDNWTTSSRLNSTFAEKSLDAILGKASMT